MQIDRSLAYCTTAYIAKLFYTSTAFLSFSVPEDDGFFVFSSQPKGDADDLQSYLVPMALT